MRKQVDMSRFHRNLLERIADPASSDRKEGEEGKERRPSSSTESKPSRGAEEEEEEEAERKKERVGRRESEDQSQERHCSESPLSEASREPQTELPGDGVEKNQERQVSEEPEERRNSSGSAPGEEEKGQERETPSASLFPPTVDKEGRRKAAAIKRTNEETLGSARDRYLARKKAKLTAPVISDD